MLKSDGHYAGDLVSLDFKSESLQGFLETVVTMVNQHSQRINVLEIDKIGVEDVKKGNLELVDSAKLSPVFGKEIALQTVNKLDSFSESVTGLGSNLTNHASGIPLVTQPCSISTRGSRRPTRESTAYPPCWIASNPRTM